MSIRAWKCPWYDIGRFTYKGLGESSRDFNKDNNSNLENKNNFDIGNINWDNFRNILLDVLRKYVTPAIALYATITELKKMIKEHNLEDKLDKAIEEFRKNNKQNSNKNNQESAADVLYKDSKIKEQKEKQESEYKSKLLNILGDKATHADVLYATSKELEEKIKELGLGDGLKNFTKQKSAEFAIGKHYDSLFYGLANKVVGKDAAGMLDLAHGINMNDRNYIKDVIHIDNYNDPKVASDKEYLKKKVSDQFKDYNFDINKIKGYFFKSDSSICKMLIMNEDFRKIIRNNKNNILNNLEFSAEFPKYKNGINTDSNLHNAFGFVDFRNSYFDKTEICTLKCMIPTILMLKEII